MKLTKKHIGKLFDNEGDGSWIYQLVDIKKDKLLFYSFDNKYIIESNKFSDWVPFEPKPFYDTFSKDWKKRIWKEAQK